MYIPKSFVEDIARERYGEFVLTPVLINAAALTAILDTIDPADLNYLYVGVLIGGLENGVIFAQLDGQDITVDGAKFVPNEQNLDMISEVFVVNRREFVQANGIPLMFQYMSTQGIGAQFVGYKITPLN
jgi:hypothetical protein